MIDYTDILESTLYRDALQTGVVANLYRKFKEMDDREALLEHIVDEDPTEYLLIEYGNVAYDDYDYFCLLHSDNGYMAGDSKHGATFTDVSDIRRPAVAAVFDAVSPMVKGDVPSELTRSVRDGNAYYFWYRGPHGTVKFVSYSPTLPALGDEADSALSTAEQVLNQVFEIRNQLWDRS